MTRVSEQNFINKDGSIDTTRAIRAGHAARADALREMTAALGRMIKVRCRKNPA